LPKLPVVSGTEVVRALKRAGFVVDRQRGSHVTLWHPGQRRAVMVPLHGEDLPPGTLRSILRQSGLSVEDLRKLL
jgi:predicted RNA binding protein YcfA (HicA-like mRNA interferase family)